MEREVQAHTRRRVRSEPRALEAANQEKCVFLLSGTTTDTHEEFSWKSLESRNAEGQGKTSAIWYKVSLPIILRDSSSLSYPWFD